VHVCVRGRRECACVCGGEESVHVCVRGRTKENLCYVSVYAKKKRKRETARSRERKREREEKKEREGEKQKRQKKCVESVCVHFCVGVYVCGREGSKASSATTVRVCVLV